VIRAIRGRITVGIRFFDLSDRKRQQVMELIGEIQQMRAMQRPLSPRPRMKATRQTAVDCLLLTLPGACGRSR
jgi:hypothetical protein